MPPSTTPPLIHSDDACPRSIYCRHLFRCPPAIIIRHAALPAARQPMLVRQTPVAPAEVRATAEEQ